MPEHVRPLDDAAFRQALGRFASGVTVVTTVEDGVDHALTASAFTSVGLRPPRVLVCVDRSNRFHDVVVRTGRWSVSVLAEGGEGIATWLATRGRPLVGQLDDVPHHRHLPGAPVLVDHATAWLACTTWRAHDGGDHTILVGDVTYAEVAEPSGAPLLYHRSRYAGLRLPEPPAGDPA